MCLQLSEDADIEQIKKSGFDTYYVDHGTGIYPSNAAGIPFTAAYIQSKGDPITNLYEDMAAEQKARSTYEYLMQMTDDPDVLEPLRFLREREIVHFQRFGEALRIVKDYLNSQHQYIIGKPDCMKKHMEDNKKECCKEHCRENRMERDNKHCEEHYTKNRMGNNEMHCGEEKMERYPSCEKKKSCMCPNNM